MFPRLKPTPVQVAEEVTTRIENLPQHGGEREFRIYLCNGDSGAASKLA